MIPPRADSMSGPGHERRLRDGRHRSGLPSMLIGLALYNIAQENAALWKGGGELGSP